LEILLSDLINICKVLDAQLGPILRRQGFVLLEMSCKKAIIDNASPDGVIRYGEMVRKFKKVEQKRFLEIVLDNQLGNSHIRFGKGAHRYREYDLPGWPMKPISISQSISKDAGVKLMIEKAQYFMEYANEFFANTPEFWESLERK
jgi:hypothetical protein